MEETTNEHTPLLKDPDMIDSSGDKSESGIFESLVVIELRSSCSEKTVEWFLDKIRQPRDAGGCELNARKVKGFGVADGHVIHITASTHRLLIAAEAMDMKKPYIDGSLRELTLSSLAYFQNAGDLDTMLSMADKQRIVKHELESMRAQVSYQAVPGVPKTVFFEGEAIVPRLLHDGIITKMFALHNREKLKLLSREWYRSFFKKVPIDDIQQYFGESVAMYFSFLNFYTLFLIPPAVIGFFTLFPMFNSIYITMFFCVFNMIWATVFLEGWKRHCCTLAYQWGTIGVMQFEEARAAYKGPIGTNPITGRLECNYPKWKRLCKFYLVSVPIVLFSLKVAFWLMLVYFWVQDIADTYYIEHPTWAVLALNFVPSIIYSIIIYFLNQLYRKMARFLNDWENHRLQSAYDNHLIVKLVLFDFVNCFVSLFYVAFYMQNMVLLRQTLAMLLITQQVIEQIIETVLPYVLYKRRKINIRDLQRSREHVVNQIDPAICAQAEVEATRDEFECYVLPHHVQLQACLEMQLDDNSMGTLDDYLEMFLQFGYVFLFSAVFPSAAFWAVVNNVMEVRTDAFKMCRVFRRPFPIPVANIGAWQLAFEIMSIMSVMTNCALFGFLPQIQELIPNYGLANVIMLLVIAEHVVLFLKATIAYLIPDAPDWVATTLARIHYESREALNKERSHRSAQLLQKKLTMSIASALDSSSTSAISC